MWRTWFRRRLLAWLDRLRCDVRLSIRALYRAPALATAAIATAALGIGMNTAIFSVVHAVLLEPLPYHEPDRLYTVDVTIPTLAARIGSLGGRIQDYLEWRDAGTAFSGVATMTPVTWTLTGTGEPERVGGARVSSSFFAVLGVPPARGRGFVAEEAQPGRDRVVVISHGLWLRRYGGDPSLVGKAIDLDGYSHIVVGVAPASLLVPTGRLVSLDFGPRVDVWKPLAPTSAELQGENWNQLLLLRLGPSERPGRGQQQLHALLNAPGKALPPGIELVPRLHPIRDAYAGELRPRLLVLLGASVLLLAIACTNIASLVLARVMQRSTELATRMALGAGRSALAVQLLTESMVLALAGGAAGTLVAYAGVRVLVAYGPDAALLRDATVSTPVLLFALTTSAVTGIVCGLAPALQASRGDCGRMLQGARGAIGGGRAASLGQALVGIQAALCTALLASATLLLLSFVNVMSADRGYDVQQTLAMDLALPMDRYTTGAQRVEFYRAAIERLAALPTVAAVGAISDAPAAASSGNQAIFLETDTDVASAIARRPIAGWRHVTPGYFSASRTPLRAGRFFGPADGTTTAIVGESLARALWPGTPIADIPGRRIRQGDVVDQRAPLLTVIGVVGDIRGGAVDRAMLPQLYRPQVPASGRANMTVVVRTSSAPDMMAPAIRNIIREADATIPVPAVRTMADIVRSAVAERRFQMLLTGLFAIVALLLGSVGTYGVVSYGVARRTRDIGLRLALGALRRDVMRNVLVTGVRPVAAGVVIGGAGAVLLWTGLESMLYGIEPTDPFVIGGVAGLLLATASLACAGPALRAARLDPATALRSE